MLLMGLNGKPKSSLRQLFFPLLQNQLSLKKIEHAKEYETKRPELKDPSKQRTQAIKLRITENKMIYTKQANFIV